MLLIKRRVEKIEDAMRRARQRAKMIVVFSHNGLMKIVGGDIDRICPAEEGGRLLFELSEDSTVIHFNIPRPGMVITLGRWEPVNHLERRITKLESLIKPDAGDPYADRPFTWEKDWSREEKQLACNCIIRGEPVPPELVEKAHLTRPSGRLVGLTEEEIRALADELRERGDEPEDDEPESEMF